MKHTLLAGLLSSVLATLTFAAPQPKLENPFVFTDEEARISTGIRAEEIACHVSTITAKGFGPKRTAMLQVVDGIVTVQPLAEGIHRVDLGPPVNSQVRFLAITPPAALNAEKVTRQLPRRGKALLVGEPFTMLVMGDSVSHTGEYGTMLARMLERATGNTKIRVVKKAYSGRSVDATVRHFDRDTTDLQPDLGLLMYGLNDQLSFAPFRAYVEQCTWVTEQLSERFGADTIFLQPTPHIDTMRTAPDGTRKPAEFAFRTIGFAGTLSDLGTKLNVPVAETFRAMWGSGKNSVDESAVALWPFYPQSYREPFSTLLESTGKGDTIHPNALGHLQIARAAFNTIGGVKDTPPLTVFGSSRWTADGVVSKISVANSSDKARSGRLEPYPPTEAKIAGPATVPYELQPGESLDFEVSWPEAKTPEDLLHFPNDIYLNQDLTPVFVVDFSDGGSRVYSASCPFAVRGDFKTRRIVSTGREVVTTLQTKEGEREKIILIPEGSLAGRIPFVEKLTTDGQTGYVVAEAVYTAVAIAPVGEAEIDGRLEEWDDQPSVPVGLPCQARGWRGPLDNRSTPAEARADFFFKSGRDGIYLAMRGEGDPTGDTITVFFDPRVPAQLGYVGPYYWVNLTFEPAGRIRASKGETSVTGEGLKGAWLPTETGLEAEFFVPYTVFNTTAWPQSGDLGLSIVWRHKHADGRVTRLTWSENGHEWNPRWYGIVQRTAPDEQAPTRYMVRIR